MPKLAKLQLQFGTGCSLQRRNGEFGPLATSCPLAPRLRIFVYSCHKNVLFFAQFLSSQKWLIALLFHSWLQFQMLFSNII